MIDKLIIGAGAAGLYASSLLPDAALLEGSGSCGRKLLLTGGGRCNYTHDLPVPDLIAHYHGSLPFIRKVLYAHTPQDIIERFESLGIEARNEDGKIFPIQGDARTVLAALSSHAPRIIDGKAVEMRKDGSSFIVTLDDGRTIESGSILLATGGNAYPHTGSDGSGYHLARMMRHRIDPPHPALSALDIVPSLSAAEGITAEISLKIGKSTVSGSAVITRRGLSGPCAEDFSHLIIGRQPITICFCRTSIQDLRRESGASLMKNALPIPPRLAAAVLGPLAEKRIANLSASEARRAEELLSAFPCTASPIAASAMSTAGGVETSSIDPSTMESKIVPGLYFAGDIIDVDADCGGYSLTWAFATAWIASHSMQRAEDRRFRRSPG